MTLHMLKLCVGCESIADLESWIEETRLLFQRLGRPYRQFHTTRMVPKKADDLLDGGSLYWVIKGRIAARQRIEAIEPFTAEDGIQRCHLVLEPVVFPVQTRPCRPFQGWRYLPPGDAPADIRGDSAPESMPQAMRDDLRALGLL